MSSRRSHDYWNPTRVEESAFFALFGGIWGKTRSGGESSEGFVRVDAEMSLGVVWDDSGGLEIGRRGIWGSKCWKVAISRLELENIVAVCEFGYFYTVRMPGMVN